MAGAQKNTKKFSTIGEDIVRPAQRLASFSSCRSFGSQSVAKFYRPSGVPSAQSYKARKVISF